VGVEPKTILIVSEDAGERSAWMRALQPDGWTVEVADNIRQAMVRMSRGGLNLMVAAAENGHAVGAELLQAVGRMRPPLPVILVSACGSVAAAVEALQNGARDYLVRPVAPERLAAAVRTAVTAADSSAGREQAPERRVGPKAFITHDPRLLEVLAMARQVSRSTATVLIQGESGTGKELLAGYIHRHGLYPEAPYVAVNCAALPETLAESELFGHEKGAFTGAVMRKIGKFELAKKGTLAWPSPIGIFRSPS